MDLATALTLAFVTYRSGVSWCVRLYTYPIGNRSADFECESEW